MKVLIVCDAILSKHKIKHYHKEDAIYFSLSSEKSINDFNITIIRELYNSLDHRNSSLLINNELDELGETLERWRIKYSEVKCNNKTLLDEFSFDDNISSYYFTTLVERNVYKYANYKYVAQYQAIRKVLRENNDIDTLLFSVKDQNLRHALGQVKNRNSDFQKLDVSNSNVSIKTRGLLRYILNFLKGFAYILRLVLWSNLANFYSKNTETGAERDNRVALLSYFPFYDLKSAKANNFRNLYYLPLQEYLSTEGIKHSWLFMYAQIRGSTYLDSLRVAKRLVQDQYVFLEENISFVDIITITKTWLQQCFKYWVLRKKLFNKAFFDDVDCIERVYIKNSLDFSFFGIPVLSGIYYYFAFKNFSKKTNNQKLLIYLNEMQTWERACNVAFEKHSRSTLRIGFQHTSVARRLFHYFSELKDDKDTRFSEPLPDYFAVNGVMGFQQLKKSYSDRLVLVEALRQLNQQKTTIPFSSIDEVDKVKNQIVYVGSYDENEAYKIFNLIVEAFRFDKNYKIVVVSHPSRDLRPLVDIANKKYDCTIETGNRSLNDYLLESQVAIVGSSTAAVEAVRHFCKVIVPLFPDHIVLSPLSGFDGFFQYVTSSNDLVTQVKELMEYRYKQKDLEEIHEFIDKFWLLDSNLTQWRRIIDNGLSSSS